MLGLFVFMGLVPILLVMSTAVNRLFDLIRKTVVLKLQESEGQKWETKIQSEKQFRV